MAKVGDANEAIIGYRALAVLRESLQAEFPSQCGLRFDLLADLDELMN